MSEAQSAPQQVLRLSQLLPDLSSAAAGISVSDVTLDSGSVQPGGLFLACPGRSTHGLQHVSEAIARGARAVLFEPQEALIAPQLPAEIFVAAVAGLSRRVGDIADKFFDRPSARLSVTGITGTNGKTTCAWLLANALERCGRPAGYMGTIGVGMTGASRSLSATKHTTSDAITVHRQLNELLRAGAQCVAMEVSSHALDQGRVAAVRFQVAAFTNLTRDHLDYHRSMHDYGAAKARLFEWPDLVSRVINVDDEFGVDLAVRYASTGRLIVTARKPAGVAAAQRFAATGAVELCARNLRLDGLGMSCEIVVDGRQDHFRTSLVGDFNVDNVLTVLGMLLALDVPRSQAIAALGRCRAPPGRMEMFGGGTDPLVLVDYAHTPDALARALQAARSHCAGRLRVVFGCGGDRDVGKRPLMALVAAQRADEIVLTDDNPRNEDPVRIVADIVAGLPPQCAHTIIHDRAKAIRELLRRSIAGDVVVIAGKGHEDYQNYGNEKRPFSDQRVVREALGLSA